MPVQSLNFQGINRAISDFASAGACEELINLRPTTMGLVPVKPFHPKMTGVAYDRIYPHNIGTTVNYIALTLTATTLRIDYVNESGTTVITNLATETITSYENFSLDMVSVAATGNIILFSICDKADTFYLNRSWIWRGSTTGYAVLEADVPEIDITIGPSAPAVKGLKNLFTFTTASSEQEIVEQLSNALTAIQEKNKDYCFGPIIIAIGFKTTDGKSFWTGQWYLFDPCPSFHTLTGWYKDSSWSEAASFNSFFNTYEHGFIARSANKAAAPATKLSITLKLTGSWDADTSMLKSVEIYTSKPQPAFDASILYGQSALVNGEVTTLLPQIPYKDMKLEDQLLYHQKSIPLADLKAAGSSGKFYDDFIFGGNIITTNTTLVADAGATTRFGKMLSYNDRFHFYDSNARRGVSLPQFVYDIADFPNANIVSWPVMIEYDNGNNRQWLYVGSASLPDQASIEDNVSKIMVICANTAIKTVYIWRGFSPEHAYTFPMTSSSRYNYSVFIDGSASHLTSSAVRPVPSNPVTYVDVDEPSAINVTEQNNPFVFSVKNSYYAPGKMKDLELQLVPVSDVSFGDYPLNAFTTNGVFALLQGSGTVLYGEFKPVSNLVTMSNSMPTESGTFFIAAGGLWLIAGNRAVLVSDALSLGPHKEIRYCNGFRAISESEYDVSAVESQVPFEEFVVGASLSYNRYRDELMICNAGYAYTYVLSLKYRQWFKFGCQVFQFLVGGNIAWTNPDVYAFAETKLAKIQQLTQQLADELRLSLTIGGTSYTLNFDFTQTEQTTLADLQSELQRALDTRFAGTVLSGVQVRITGSRLTAQVLLSFPKSILDNTGLSGTLASFDNSGRTPVMMSSESFVFTKVMNVIDLSQEDSGEMLVHLQSRPISFSYGYSHIHRMVSMIRAVLASSHELIPAVYGSDDLTNWTLISYAKRSNVTISQIRTASAARSWRYYTIVIGGVAPTDTDFGPIMVDYKPVIRRIG